MPCFFLLCIFHDIFLFSAGHACAGHVEGEDHFWRWTESRACEYPTDEAGRIRGAGGFVTPCLFGKEDPRERVGEIT